MLPEPRRRAERKWIAGVVSMPASGSSVRQATSEEDHSMLGWAITFLVIAIVAGLFGFGVIASASAGIAQLIFFAFVILFALSIIFGSVRTPSA